MITQTGAALIATVYPIGLLVVAVNRGELKPAPFPQGWKRWIRTIVETIQGLAIIGAVVSVMGCVAAVSLDQPISNGSYVFWITVSGVVLGVSAMSVLQSLAFKAALGVRSRERTRPRKFSSSRAVRVRKTRKRT